MRKNFGLVSLVALLGACEPSSASTTDASAGGVITSSFDLPTSLESMAAEVRGLTGAVLVAETVSIDATGYTEPAFAGGPAGVYERYPIRTLTVRVVDALGATDVPETFSIVTIAGPVELIDAAGAPVTAWRVEGGPPPEMRSPPDTGRWVFFGYPGRPGFEAVRFVARFDGELVSGDYTDENRDLALDALRL